LIPAQERKKYLLPEPTPRRLVAGGRIV